MAFLPPAQKVPLPGPNGTVVLTARVWALLRDAYKAAGLPETSLVVTQGSWHHGSASGTTHDGGGAFDLRVWNLPAAKHEALVVELRKRNVCAWKRDKAHGGFDPHIHGIVRDEADLSRGALYQCREYDQGRDGLASQGKDYHPRPTQHPFVYATPPAPYPGKPIGWPSPRTTSSGPAITTLEKCFGLPQTGNYGKPLRDKIAGWQITHPGPWAKDRVGVGAAGPSLYAGIVSKLYPGA